MTLNVLLDERYKTLAILAFFMLADTLDVAKLSQRGGLDSGQRMKHLIAENDVGWEAFFCGTRFSELAKGFEQLGVFDASGGRKAWDGDGGYLQTQLGFLLGCLFLYGLYPAL